MGSMKPREAHDPNRPTRLGVTLSVVYPGLGQFVQRRYVAGTAFLMTATAMFIMLVVSFIAIIVNYYRLWLAPSEVEVAPMVVRFMTWFGLLLIVYAAAVMDAYLAYRRQSREWASKKHKLPPELPQD